MKKVVLAPVVVLMLLSLFSTPVSSSEVTSGDYGEGYVGIVEGIWCYEPVPDDDPETLAFTPAEYMWLNYGDPVVLYSPQPEMYFGWLYVIASGTPCLVEQGSILTYDPLGGSDDVALEDTTSEEFVEVPTSPEPDQVEQTTEEVDITSDPEVAEVTTTSSEELPPAVPAVAAEAEPQTYVPGDPIIGFPSTGDGFIEYNAPDQSKEKTIVVCASIAALLLGTLGGAIWAAHRKEFG